MAKSSLYQKDAETGISVYYKILGTTQSGKLYSFTCYLSVLELQKAGLKIEEALSPFNEAYMAGKNTVIKFTQPRYYTTPSNKYFKIKFSAYADEDFALFARSIESIFQFFRNKGYKDKGSAFGRGFKRQKRSFYSSVYENFELPCNENVVFLVENKSGKSRFALSFVEGGKRIPIDKFSELRKILTDPNLAGYDDGVFLHKFYYVPSDQVYFLETDNYYENEEHYPRYKAFAERICEIINGFYGQEPAPIPEPVGEPSVSKAQEMTELIESLEVSLKYLPKDQQDVVTEQIEAYKIALKYL